MYQQATLTSCAITPDVAVVYGLDDIVAVVSDLGVEETPYNLLQ